MTIRASGARQPSAALPRASGVSSSVDGNGCSSLIPPVSLPATSMSSYPNVAANASTTLHLRAVGAPQPPPALPRGAQTLSPGARGTMSRTVPTRVDVELLPCVLTPRRRAPDRAQLPLADPHPGHRRNAPARPHPRAAAAAIMTSSASTYARAGATPRAPQPDTPRAARGRGTSRPRPASCGVPPRPRRPAAPRPPGCGGRWGAYPR